MSTPTPPADDVREAVARVIEAAWGDPTWDGETLRPVDRKIADAVIAAFEVCPRGTVTEAEALRFGKVAWVAHQDDESWAKSVVEDCFSPADDLPEEALGMIAVARAVLETAREARP